ncbi:alanine--glyoxylate aminotransferase family protein [Myxococcota bacterium]|nr:alanine--glyoxylate aminotransferase family protein [Myxococcota bacterium]MBU1535202.1 alanine--glyoxylate aminotransferase family protein [Myxococcota bacterium]
MNRTHDDSTRVLGYIEGILNYNKKASSYVLLNPGPVLTSPRVKAALVHHDMCHRDIDFSVLVENLRSKLKSVFRGNEEHEVLPITGSGTSAIEASIASAIPRNKKVLIIVNGAFGERYLEVANVHKMDIVECNFGWANNVDVDLIEEKLAADPEIAAVMMAHHETSVGLLNPINAIGALCRKYNALFIVDAVSSLGAEDLDVVRDNIDVCLSSANKAIHAIAGVAFVCVNSRAWKVMETIEPRLYYLDLRRYRKYATEQEQTPFTPAVSSFFALDAAIDELLEDTLEKRLAMYKQKKAFMRNGFLDLGFEFLTNFGNESNTLSIVKVPEYINFTDLYSQMKEFGYILYNCKDDLENKFFQVSNMGNLSFDMINQFLGHLRFVLARAQKASNTASSALSETEEITPFLVKTW